MNFYYDKPEKQQSLRDIAPSTIRDAVNNYKRVERPIQPTSYERRVFINQNDWKNIPD